MRLLVRCLAIAACIAGISGIVRAEEIDNPAYAAWAKYPPLTTVTYEKTDTGSGFGHGGQSHLRLTHRLAGVTAEHVTIELLVTLSTTRGVREVSRGTFSIPAKIDRQSAGVPPLQVDHVEKMVVKESKEGKDTIDVKGVKTECTTRAMTVEVTFQPPQNTSATMDIKTWSAAGVPGGLVKMENHAQMALDDGRTSESSYTMTLVDFNIPK